MSQAVRYDAAALQDAMEERVGQYEAFREQLMVLKEKMVAVTNLGEAFEGKAAERIKEFFKAQSEVVESWIQFVDQQIAFMSDVGAMANDRELGSRTMIDVPFLDSEMQTAHAKVTALVMRQQKDLANILSSINDLISLQAYSSEPVEQSIQDAKQKRWDTVEAVEEYDHALVSEYSQSEESQMLIAGLFDAMMNATSQNGEITPMSFNSEAFEASTPYQVKDEVQERSMDYIAYKQEQQDVREAIAMQEELDARSGLEKFWDGTKTFVGEFSGYYDSQRASTGIDPVSGKELSTAERIAAGGMAAAGYIPIVGWLGRGAKAGKAIYSLNKGMDAVDTTLGVYKSTKSMTYVSQAEKGIYGLVAANGMSGYLLGQDLLGHKLTEEERQESLMMAGMMSFGSMAAVTGKMAGTLRAVDDVPGGINSKITGNGGTSGGKAVYGKHYDEAVDLHKDKPDWFPNPDESTIVQGDELIKARAEYNSLTRKGELEKGHHIQGLWSGGKNIESNIKFTGESTIKRDKLSELDLDFYHEKGYGKETAKILKIHQTENGVYVFGNNPMHTEATVFQNKVMKWQKDVGLRE